ncbi:MAG TPA: iron ABC transporter permease [Chloroflexi bacterium]|nr:iron ABC transporter permease [Chloroflexota bacterium]HHW86478.1 iron ABC transporter permease [Chloroflexota bacterium]
MNTLRRPPWPLALIALLVSLLAVTPLIYIIFRAVSADPATWARLWSGQMPDLLWQTAVLLVGTIAFALVVGVGMAWLVERSDLPGRSLWRVLLALPLALPGYVAAITYIILLRRGGVVERLLIDYAGVARGEVPLPSLYNVGGAILIIGLVTYPYIYLPTAAALRSVDRSLEEAARMLGRSGWNAFRQITLPLVLPAVAGGALLVGLYVLSDFGTVAMLRYRTFTTAIYNQFTGQIDRSGAAILSVMLILLALPLLFGESWFSRRKRRLTSDTVWRPRQLVKLGRWRWLALTLTALVVLLALGLPLLVLGGLSIQGWLFPTEADRIWGINNEGILAFGFNSLLVATLAATFATTLALGPLYLAVRFPSRLSRIVLTLSRSPFALPGIIIGLAFVLLINRWAPFVYGTIFALIFAFVFRLLPQSLSTGESALRSVAPSLEEAARTMGVAPARVFWRVTLPVAAPGILASWVLVFITAMKELPTAILLRPPGFDTLPVRIWAAASESVHTQAAPPAFLLILLTTLLLLPLMHSQLGIDRAMQENL